MRDKQSLAQSDDERERFPAQQSFATFRVACRIHKDIPFTKTLTDEIRDLAPYLE